MLELLRDRLHKKSIFCTKSSPLVELYVQSLRAMMRKPSCLISCSHWRPEGSLSVFVGRHGAMNPAGRVRIRNIMPIARDYNRASQSFYLRVLRERRMIQPPDAASTGWPGRPATSSTISDRGAGFKSKLIRARTGEGRARARARGVRFGRPRKMTPHQRQEALSTKLKSDHFNGGGSTRSESRLNTCIAYYSIIHGQADNLLRCFRDVPWLPVTLLIRADKLCIGQDVAPHCSLDLRFRRVS